MRKTLLLLLFPALAVLICSCSEMNRNDDEELFVLRDHIVYIYTSLDTPELVPGDYFTIGAEGGELSVIAYYMTDRKPLVDSYETVDDSGGAISITRTPLNKYKTRYTFTVGKNTSGEQRGVMLTLFDNTGWKEFGVDYAFGRFVVVQLGE